MSLETKLRDLITRIATEFKSVRASTGDLNQLNTQVKSSLVAAINEVKTSQANASGINDQSASTSSTYSSSKIEDLVNQAVTDLIDGSPVALDTLKELADKLLQSDDALASLVLGLDSRLRFDDVQTLTSTQQLQARENISVYSKAEIGDINRDFVADFVNALS